MTIRLGVLISGSGSNLQAVLDAIAAGELDAAVAVVISSKPGVLGLERAANADVETVALTPEDYREPAAANERIARELEARGVDYVVMAGYMRMLGTEVLDAFPDRVVNLHPALLPSFPGAHAIADAFRSGVKVTGVTVHFANEVYDDGPILAQGPVRILEDDTIESLESRIHEVEHRIYPQTLQLLAQGRVTIGEDRRVRIAP